jgi:integrase
MIEDMTVRGFKEDTRRDYVRHVRAFAVFIGRSPDTATAEDLRLFQLHQTQIGMQPPSINSAVSALRFFFTVTLDRPDLARRLTVVPHPRRIPAVLSVEEVTLLLRAASGPKYKAAFATAYGAGLRVSEVVALKVGDVDSELLELLRVWWREGRRRSLLLPGGWLFPGRNPVEPLSARQLCRARPGRGDQEARVATHATAQLRHAPPRARCRYSRDPDASRSRDILPTNTRSRGGFTIRFTPGAARPCSLPGNMPTVVLNWSLFRSPTGRSPVYRRG